MRSTNLLLLLLLLLKCLASMLSESVCQRGLSESVEQAGRLFAAFVEVVCVRVVCLFGFIYEDKCEQILLFTNWAKI